jgi:hypothetical protein
MLQRCSAVARVAAARGLQARQATVAVSQQRKSSRIAGFHKVSLRSVVCGFVLTCLSCIANHGHVMCWRLCGHGRGYTTTCTQSTSARLTSASVDFMFADVTQRTLGSCSGQVRPDQRAG